MCIIIDTNRFGEFKNKNRNTRPIWKWLDDSGGKIVYSPTTSLKREWKKFPYKGSWIGLVRRGATKSISPNLVQKKEDELKCEPRSVMKSDDEHILALALVSGAKLLFSKDKKLCSDFENPDLVGGSVYKLAYAKRLLTTNTCP